MSQSVSTLNALMKYVVPKELNVLVPDGVKLYNMLPELSEASGMLGRKYLMPVEASSEGGVTYGDGTAFTYNGVVDALYPEAQIDCNPVVMNAQLSRSAMDRLASDKKAFVSWATLKTKGLYQALAQRAEISLFYGQTGLGTVGSTSVTGTSGTITITTASFAAGIWGGRRNHQFDVYNGATKINANAPVVLQSVNVAAGTIAVTGNATDLAAIAAGHKFYFMGEKTNGFMGLDGLLSTSGTVMGLDNTVYDLWAGNTAAVGGAISMAAVLDAVATCVAKGGLADDVMLWVAPAQWEVLNNSLSAQRRYSDSTKKAENGFGAITYHSQAGDIQIISSSIIKRSEGFIFSKKNLKRVGVKDISFKGGDGEGDYFVELPNNYGCQLQCSYEFAVYLEKPAQAIKLTGLT